MLHSLSHLLLILAALAPRSLALSQPDLRQRSIYQVLTDRFARSDDIYAPCELAEKQYCGGSWKGIERRLEYIQGMGFDTGQFRPAGSPKLDKEAGWHCEGLGGGFELINTVWISPIVANIETRPGAHTAYHGRC